jgi:hyperosmotically inducible protein
MNNYMKLIGSSLAVLGLSVVEPAFADNVKAKTQVADFVVTAKTKIILAADGRVKGHQVSVDTRKGVVKLRGKVDNDEAKTVAFDLTKNVEGVKSVDNELQVVAPGKRDSVEEKDEAITASIKKQIDRDAKRSKDKRLKAAKIAIVTNAGVVSLSGEVPTIIVSAQASWTAWNVRGVRSVKNDLIVSAK